MLFHPDTPIQEILLNLLLLLPAILISLTVHEFSHAYVAYRCGDPTARNLGRLTLNPIKHIDPIGFLMLIIVGFGYAKPVPINPRNFGKPKRDLVLVSIAGPLSNLILGFVGVFIFRLCLAFGPYYLPEGFVGNLWHTWLMFVSYLFSINIGLAVFNILPIPPLDGSRLLSVLLPAKWALTLAKYENILMIVIFILLFFTPVLNPVLNAMRQGVLGAFHWLINLLPFMR